MSVSIHLNEVNYVAVDQKGGPDQQCLNKTFTNFHEKKLVYEDSFLHVFYRRVAYEVKNREHDE